MTPHRAPRRPRLKTRPDNTDGPVSRTRNRASGTVRALVIGGAGFVGANMVRRCLAQPGVEVTVMDSLDPHLHATTKHLQAVWNRITFVRADLRDENVLAQLIQGQDVIFNCAAQTSHPLSIQYPLLDADINCVGNLKLLESVRHLNRNAVVVYTSSSTVVGKSRRSIIDEEHPERPLEIYSANKSAAEKYYRIYNTLHDLKTVVLRFANLYGPYGKGFPEFGFINYFIHLAAAGKNITLYGTGRQLRNVMYVEDATDLLWRAWQEPRVIGDPFFATGDEHLSVAQIAQAIVRVFRSGKVIHIDWPEERKRIEIDSAKFSSKRIRALTGWAPHFTFDQGLERTRSEMRSSPAAR